MRVGPCLHYDCTNRNSFGYCQTSACINPNYAREWVESTSASASVVERPVTNGDRIRAMTDRELAKWLSEWAGGAPNCDREGEDLKTCLGCWYEWLKDEVDNG